MTGPKNGSGSGPETGLSEPRRLAHDIVQACLGHTLSGPEFISMDDQAIQRHRRQVMGAVYSELQHWIPALRLQVAAANLSGSEPVFTRLSAQLDELSLGLRLIGEGLIAAALIGQRGARPGCPVCGGVVFRDYQVSRRWSGDPGPIPGGLTLTAHLASCWQARDYTPHSWKISTCLSCRQASTPAAAVFVPQQPRRGEAT